MKKDKKNEEKKTHEPLVLCDILAFKTETSYAIDETELIVTNAPHRVHEPNPTDPRIARD